MKKVKKRGEKMKKLFIKIELFGSGWNENDDGLKKAYKKLQNELMTFLDIRREYVNKTSVKRVDVALCERTEKSLFNVFNIKSRFSI